MRLPLFQTVSSPPSGFSSCGPLETQEISSTAIKAHPSALHLEPFPLAHFCSARSKTQRFSEVTSSHGKFSKLGSLFGSPVLKGEERDPLGGHSRPCSATAEGHHTEQSMAMGLGMSSVSWPHFVAVICTAVMSRNGKTDSEEVRHAGYTLWYASRYSG